MKCLPLPTYRKISNSLNLKLIYINKYENWFQQVATPSVVKKILRMKQEQPTMFAWEIREQLARQGACDPQSLPSVSSVNRILRGGGLQTEHTGLEGGSSTAYQPQMPANIAGVRGRLYYNSLGFQRFSWNKNISIHILVSN